MSNNYDTFRLYEQRMMMNLLFYRNLLQKLEELSTTCVVDMQICLNLMEKGELQSACQMTVKTEVMKMMTVTKIQIKKFLFFCHCTRANILINVGL